MRLNEKEIRAIVETATGIFGQGVKVYLFGSRTKDQMKGGDIDLIIDAPEEKMNLKNKLIFLVRVKKTIGDQKMDVIYERKARYFLPATPITRGSPYAEQTDTH